MNDDEIMNLLNSIDDDLIDKRIDELLNKTGGDVNMSQIKEKAMKKIANKKRGTKVKYIFAAAIAATLAISTVYADEISGILQSFFNKSIVYSTVVDGDAYYLPESIRLNDDFTLSRVSLSKDDLDIVVKANDTANADKAFENIDIAIIPMDNPQVRYFPGGYMSIGNGECFLSFINETEANQNIVPFKDFKLQLNGMSYDISLAKAENVMANENLIVGKPEATNVPEATEAPQAANPQINPLIANVAGAVKANNGLTNIRLVASFDDPDLKLNALGEPDFEEFTYMFENKDNGGVISSGNSSMSKPILAYDKDNNSYTLTEPEGEIIGRPITIFETTAKQGTDLTVKLPAISAGYEKKVADITIAIPKEGEAVIDKELDLIIQKAVVKTIKRTSENSAVVTFDLNTSADKTVFITNLSPYSKDVQKAELVIKDDTATMTMTFDKDLDKADFIFDWPNYVIRGNWSIELEN